MTTKHDLTFVEVVRPVRGAGEFLARARTLSELIFESDDLVTVVQISDSSLVGNEGPVIIGAPAQSCRIYSPENMRMPLLERITIPETRTGGKFSKAFKDLSNGRIRHTDKQAVVRGEKPRFDVPPLKAELYQIQLEHDFPMADKVTVELNAVGERVGEGLNGDVELVLLPTLYEPAARMLRAQERKCAEILGRLSRNIAYPSSHQSLGVPFARLSEHANPDQVEKFVEALQGEHLPARMVLGEPRITGQFSS